MSTFSWKDIKIGDQFTLPVQDIASDSYRTVQPLDLSSKPNSLDNRLL